MQTATQKERPTENSATGTAAVREFVTKTVHAAETQLENLGQEAARIKTSVASAVTEAVEDGRHAAHKAIKRARVRTEDLVDETALQIRQAPFRSVAIALGVGAAIGLITGILFRGISRR